MKRYSQATHSIQNTLWFRTLKVFGYGIFFVFLSGTVFLIFQGRHLVEIGMVHEEVVAERPAFAQFPVGVDIQGEQIIENPGVDLFFQEHVVADAEKINSRTSLISKVIGRLALMNWYQNLASLSSRVLVIRSGERKEEVAQHFGKILGWTEAQRKEFLQSIEETAPLVSEGKLFPGAYTVPRGSLPSDVAPLVIDRFNAEVIARYGEDVSAQVPLDDALIVASLLEREAYDFEDMRHISGVIWNRLFADMKLQLDASLQYAKGSKAEQPWWPRVVPADKYIASEFNTYKIKGLPPAPIANPSLDAILAALNPTKTECMFYFHDKKAGFHCTETYAEHVALLKQYYGQGK